MSRKPDVIGGSLDDRACEIELLWAIDTVHYWRDRYPRDTESLKRYEELERIAGWRAW